MSCYRTQVLFSQGLWRYGFYYAVRVKLCSNRAAGLMYLPLQPNIKIISISGDLP